MKNTVLLIILMIPLMAFGEECTKEKSLKIGIDAIERKYPNMKDTEPYTIKDIGEFWAVAGAFPKGEFIRGRNPTAVINKKTCTIEHWRG